MPPRAPSFFALADRFFARERTLLSVAFLLPVIFEIAYRLHALNASPFSILWETFPQPCIPVAIVYLCAGFPWRHSLAMLLVGALAALVPQNEQGIGFVFTALGWSGLAATALLVQQTRRGDRERAIAVWWGLVPLFFTAITAPAGLNAGSALYSSRVYDGILVPMEASLLHGHLAYLLFLALGHDHPSVLHLLELVYESLNLVFAGLTGLAIRFRYHRISIPVFLVVSGVTAGLFYSVMPVIGPLASLRLLRGPIPPGRFEVPPTLPKNGMPSMHMGWAAAVFLLAMDMPSRPLRYAAAIFAMLTGFSAVANGEHYVVDLIVGAPFCLFFYALMQVGGEVSKRKIAMTIFGSLVLFWYIGIMVGPLPSLSQGPLVGLCVASLAATLVAAIRLLVA